MMLSNVLPKEQLASRIGPDISLEEFGKDDLSAITKKKPETIHQIGASVWNRIVNRKWHKVAPQRLAEHFRRVDPNLHVAISGLLGIEVIHDIYYARAWKGSKKKANLAVELLIAWVYKSDLLLADVMFADPQKKIARADRTYELQTHCGLGLLPKLMQNLQAKGDELKCDQLTLTAGTRDLVPLFESHGFKVEDSITARSGMVMGYGIPMERDLR